MFRAFRRYLAPLVLLFSIFVARILAQTPETGTATLRELHIGGVKSIAESDVLPLTGLYTGAQVCRKDLQSAADRLLQSGHFAKRNYHFRPKVAGPPGTTPVDAALPHPA